MKVVEAPNEEIPDDILRRMRHLLTELLKKERVPLVKAGIETSLPEFISCGDTLRFYLVELKDSAYPKAAEVKKAMEPYALFEEGSNEAFRKILEAFDAAELACNDLSSHLYWLERKVNFRPYGTRGIESLVLVHKHVPEKIHVVFDETSRPAIRVSWASEAYQGAVAMFVRPAQLGFPDNGEDERINVYIQMHALERLRERLDCIPTGLIDAHLCGSFVEPSIHHEKNGTVLIEYKIGEIKAGYLVSEIKDNALVIRTFLFVTNGGTPEGRRLQEICGLGRLDREFLAIDKLSTFMATDLRSDKEVERLFLEAGCECLIQLHDAAAGFNMKEGMPSAMEKMRKYFGLDSKHDFMMPDLLDKFSQRFEEETG